jgi:hypothetical protein
MDEPACGDCALYQRASASRSASLTGPIAARISGTSRLTVPILLECVRR